MSSLNKDKLNINIDIEKLAKSHHKKLLYFVLHKVRNEEDAQDIVQSTFIEALKSLHNFRSEAKPETWLTGIAINLIKNHFYQQKQKPTFYLEEEQYQLEKQVYEKTPESTLIDKQLINEIEHVFASMPNDMRYTAEQVLLNNISYKEASNISYSNKKCKKADKNNNDNNINVDIIFPIPIGTVRSRVARAREMLRKLKSKK